jgi:hypothetical protein
VSPLRRYQDSTKAHFVLAVVSGVLAGFTAVTLGATQLGSCAIGLLTTWALLMTFLYIDEHH